MSEEDFDAEAEPSRWFKEAFTVIGALIVYWANAEKAVSNAITAIERHVCHDRNVWPPVTTDLSAFRDFKERKGFLRKLVLEHGPQYVSRLDKAYQTLSTYGEIRHRLSHGQVMIMPSLFDGDAQRITIFTHERNKQTRRKEFTSSDYTVGQLRKLLAAARDVGPEIFFISADIWLDMTRASEARQEL